MAPLKTIRLLLEYEGTRYAGWQWQPGQDSIQSALQAAIFQLTGEEPVLTAAGRTDAGVHAACQVVSFRSSFNREARRFAPGLNHFLPPDITVHRSDEAAPDFDARLCSTAKHYRYRIYSGPQPGALERNRAWMLRRRLDIEAMRRGAECLIGELDFEAFRSAQCEAPHATRRMFSIGVTRCDRPPVGELVEITYHANAFCRHMCRILSGTLMEVGAGLRTAEDVAQVLASRDRRRAGVTAPPQGLTLLRVEYSDSAGESQNIE